jgi:hypothetical protein
LDIQAIVAELKGELIRIAEVVGLLEGGNPAKKRIGRPPGSVAKKVQTERRGRGLTPAGRRKLSESMKQRWAQRRGPASASKATASVAAKTTPRKSGGMSAEGRKRISEAMKKRWAEKKRKAS